MNFGTKSQGEGLAVSMRAMMAPRRKPTIIAKKAISKVSKKPLRRELI